MKKHKNIYFLFTVDCDLRISSSETRNESLLALVDVFDKNRLSGHITWFLNENDFVLTQLHQEFLKKIIKRNDAIGIHDHLDFMGSRRNYKAIYKFCSKSLERVKDWLKENKYKTKIQAHRFGNLLQHPEAYRALQNMGYSICSDVCPENSSKGLSGKPSFNNKNIPLGILPYRHNFKTIGSYKNDSGPLLQFPVIRGTLTADYAAPLSKNIINAWIKGAEKLGNKACVITFAFHPYEVVDIDKLIVDKRKILGLENVITMMRKEYNAMFISVEEYLSLSAESCGNLKA